MIMCPWVCPKCGTVMPPWVAEHRCEGDTGGAAAGAKPVPDGLIVNITGSVMSVEDLTSAFGRALRDYNRRRRIT